MREEECLMTKAAVVILAMTLTCRGCHNEKSPNFKGFDFKPMSETIAHW